AVKNWFPYSERGRAQGLVWTFGRWGGAVAPVLVIALTLPSAGLGHPGWRGAFLSLGLLGVVWVAGFSVWFRDSPREHPGVNDAERALLGETGGPAFKPPPLSWSSVLRSRTLW